ncbi:hypothetical protein FS749_011897 [Ceratobasidium sp. UAMH 11750]|nr:hypothetical protein FS749_011897 [Ceratobasidium sp. UAMH 11750]
MIGLLRPGGFNKFRPSKLVYWRTAIGKDEAQAPLAATRGEIEYHQVGATTIVVHPAPIPTLHPIWLAVARTGLVHKRELHAAGPRPARGGTIYQDASGSEPNDVRVGPGHFIPNVSLNNCDVRGLSLDANQQQKA